MPRAEWTEVPVPPIVDQALFDAAQAQLARMRHGPADAIASTATSWWVDGCGAGSAAAACLATSTCTGMAGTGVLSSRIRTRGRRTRSAVSRLDRRQAGLEQEIAHHEAEQRRLEQTQVEVAALQDYCARVRANLQHCTMEEKQRALEALDIRVTWHPEKPLEIRGSIPLDGTSGGGSMACRRHLCLLAQLSPTPYARPGHPVPREPPLP